MTNSQNWPEHVISKDVENTFDVEVTDIDGDGNQDVLNVNGLPLENYAWFKNEDGSGKFGMLQQIGMVQDPTEVSAGDIDGDGDIDIVGTSRDMLVWYENLDGKGNFGNQNEILTTTERQFAVLITDLDGDNDNDLVVNSRNDNTLSWYENLDGAGNFSNTNIIASDKIMDRSLAVGDFDGDGDFDITAGTIDSARLSWFKNVDGTADNWETIDIVSPSLAILYVRAGDIDGDNDLDIVGNSSATNQIVYWKNTDGLGTFDDFEILSSDVEIPWNLFLADLDNDSDLDVLVSSAPESSVLWFENLDGQGNFGPKKVVSDNLNATITVYAADIDGDGDQDVVSGTQIENKLAWFENTTILNIKENMIANTFSVYPNPAQSVLFIETHEIELARVTITDAKGQQVFVSNQSLSELDISNYATGMYVITLEAKDGSRTVKKFVKK